MINWYCRKCFHVTARWSAYWSIKSNSWKKRFESPCTATESYEPHLNWSRRSRESGSSLPRTWSYTPVISHASTTGASSPATPGLLHSNISPEPVSEAELRWARLPTNRWKSCCIWRLFVRYIPIRRSERIISAGWTKGKAGCQSSILSVTSSWPESLPSLREEPRLLTLKSMWPSDIWQWAANNP